MNYHLLANFRAEHEAWLDTQLTRNVAAQGGLRARAHVKASSFRRRDKLAELHAQAKAQVETLKRELTEDSGAGARHNQAATERAAREREQRLAAALATMDKLERKTVPEPKRAKPSARRGSAGDDDTPPGAGTMSRPEPERHVSTTDADARVMQMADGDFRPTFNAQLAVDADTQLIAAVALTNSGGDMGQMSPMHQDIRQRYATTPDHWLVDGGFTKLQAIDELADRGTQPVLPPPHSGNTGIEPLTPKPTDSSAQARWRAFMASDFAKALYIQRSATVECANVRLRLRRLARLNVRGLV